MLIKNQKPLMLIGYLESSLTQEIEYLIKEEYRDFSVITVDEFRDLGDKNAYQYLVAFGLDLKERGSFIRELQGLDMANYMHTSAYIAEGAVISPGAMVGPYSSVLQNARLGRNSILETYCLLSHYSSIGDNCMLHSGTMIAGRSQLGDNVMMNFRSTVLNKINICDDVTVGAVSAVTKDITVPGNYAGTPARKVS